MKNCCICLKTEQQLPANVLKDYGPRAQPICPDCIKSTPGIAAEAAYRRQQDPNAGQP